MQYYLRFLCGLLLVIPLASNSQDECFDPNGDCTLATPIEFSVDVPVRCGDTIRLAGTTELCNDWTLPADLTAWPGTGADSTAYFVRVDNCTTEPILVDGITFTPSGSGEASCNTRINYLLNPQLDTSQQILPCAEFLPLPSTQTTLSSSCGCDSVLVQYAPADLGECVACNQQCIFVGGRLENTVNTAELTIQYSLDGTSESVVIPNWSGAVQEVACFPITASVAGLTATATLPAGDTGATFASIWLAENIGQVDSTFLVATTCLASEAGTTLDTLTASTGCDSLIVTNTLLLPPPELETLAGVGCVGDAVQLVAFANVAGTYAWSTGETTSSIEVTDEAIYSVTFTDTDGCTAVASTQAFYSTVDSDITFSVAEELLISAAPLTVWEGAAVQYGALVTQALPPYEYVWNRGPELGDSVLNLVARESQDIELLVIDSFGCFNQAVLPLTVVPVNIFVPTAFSPNGDDRNDRLAVFTSKNVEEVRLQVFARFGNLVYDERLTAPETDGDGLRWTAWDGQFRNQPMLPQTF
ncbi:MAG: gliding motility-associated C-terminal domain-containing protein, partial [Bacteroidota bacterium]